MQIIVAPIVTDDGLELLHEVFVERARFPFNENLRLLRSKRGSAHTGKPNLLAAHAAVACECVKPGLHLPESVFEVTGDIAGGQFDIIGEIDSESTTEGSELAKDIISENVYVLLEHRGQISPNIE